MIGIMNRWLPLSLAVLVLTKFVAPACAQAATPPGVPSAESPGLALPTLGGNQFWSDLLLFHRWRIQRNAVTKHCRLLDENNLRHAAGTFDECRAALDAAKRRLDLPPLHGKAVILLHGLGDTRAMMGSLARRLEEGGKFQTFNVSYPSTRQGVDEHAECLASVVEHLDGIEEIHFIGYSLGNIVIRRYMGDRLRPGGRLDPRIKRFVMLAPPNHGAQFATMFGDQRWFTAALGESAQQLGKLWAWEEANLATPPVEFAIVAGGLDNGKGFNPLLPGDDDGMVTVESAQLAGARDWLLVPLLHPMIPRDPKVQGYALRFLEEGHFVAADCRHPLPAKEGGR